MAGAGAIRAGRAYVEFFSEDSKLVRGMRRIDKNLQSWGKQVTAVGSAVAAAGLAVLSPLTVAASIFSDMGSELNDMSARTGASVEALSSLGFAASQSGAMMEDVETGLKKMSKLLFAAATGSHEATITLNRLGLSVADLAKLAPEEQFRLIASRIAGIQNPTQRAAMAMQASLSLQYNAGFQQSFLRTLEEVGTGMLNDLKSFATGPQWPCRFSARRGPPCCR